MQCLKVPISDAEKVKQDLITQGLFVSDYSIESDDTFVYFPVYSSYKNYILVERALRSRKLDTLISLLEDTIPSSLLPLLPHAFDVIGSILILELKEELVPYALNIAHALLKLHKAVKTVVKKEGRHEGVCRLQDYTFLSGEETFETIHVENGVRIFLDVHKTYFSPRLSSERLRIAHEVHDGERVLVLFSGCGPYPLVIAKHSHAKEIVCVEINVDACSYMDKNIQLNKIKNIIPYCGDVREIVPKLHGKFDRIVLAAPLVAHDYLDVIVDKIKTNGIIHYYDFLDEKDIPDLAIEKVKNVFSNISVLRCVKCGQHKPRMYRVCLDFRVC